MTNALRQAIDALPPLRHTLEQHGISTKKNLGQHFLFDLNLTDKIARIAGDISALTVLEIGSGPGGLTRAILRHAPRRFVAIERDATCMPVLEELKTIAGERMELLHADALKTDYALLGGDAAIIANLPYNVGTELLFIWLETPEIFERMVLMFQKEVAERITARPGGRHYGRLAVMTQWLYSAEYMLEIPPAAFFPPPKVDSAVVRLIRRPAPLAPANRKTLQKLLHATFSQRRKMLRASLKQLTKEPEALLRQVGIDPTLRPEMLDIPAFCALAQALDTTMPPASPA